MAGSKKFITIRKFDIVLQITFNSRSKRFMIIMTSRFNQKHITCMIFNCSGSISFILTKETFILVRLISLSIKKSHFSSSCSFIISPLAIINVSIWVVTCSVTMSSMVTIVTLIVGSICKKNLHFCGT